MKKILVRIFRILCCLFIIGWAVYFGLTSYKDYLRHENMTDQTTSVRHPGETFGSWNVIPKDSYYYENIVTIKTNGMNLFTSEIGAINSKSNLFVSIHTPALTGYTNKFGQYTNQFEHRTDIYLSAYFPNELSYSPGIYYSIDGEEPILARVIIYNLKNSVLSVLLKPNVYEFNRKASKGRNITFYIQYEKEFKTYTKEYKFSLNGYSDAYTWASSILERWLRSVPPVSR